MIFELGKTYEHTMGTKIKIVALADTYMWGRCLIAEKLGTTELMAVGSDSASSINYTEIDHLNAEKGERCPDCKGGGESVYGGNVCTCVSCNGTGKVKFPMEVDSQWFCKYISFSALDNELNAFSQQGYGIFKIERMPAGDFLVVAKKGYMGGVL